MNEHLDTARVQATDTDDAALREYGRQLALDSLLELTLSRPTKVGVPRRRRWPWLVSALAASVGLGLLVWSALRPHAPPMNAEVVQRADPPPSVALAGWRIEPTGAAEYRVLAPDRVQLDRGELLVESVALADPAQSRSPLIVTTPNGQAVATGTRFYVGTHPVEAPLAPALKGPIVSNFTRVLVLVGVVTLLNSAGSVTGSANHLLAAEPEQAPVNHALVANSDFALDLYRQLAKENPGKNLFFSPYSLSSALAMTAEGARGETAAQMGQVLRFPAAARHVGADAQLIPWNTALIHSGMAELNERFTTKPVPPELRDQIATARQAVDESKRKLAEFKTAKNRKEMVAELKRGEKLNADLLTLLAQVDQYEIRVANALWGEKTYPFAPAYLAKINQAYRTGGLFPVDFRGSFEAERAKINAWVEEQTNQRIKDLLPQGSIDPDTRLVLTNAIYFKGDWQESFAESATKEQDFTLATGTKVRALLMHKDGMKAVRYAAFDAAGTAFSTPDTVPTRSQPDPKTLYPGAGGFQMVELPYKGGQLALLVLLPQETNGLADLEAKLTTAQLQTWTDKLQSRAVNVLLPKFKLETDYQLNDTLSALGMPRAFDRQLAQFDGMCAGGSANLFISKVLHKAFVEVNEKGTEAAAATAVVMEGRSLPITVPFVPTFRADKPFLYAIRDLKTGTLLFLGRMTQPK
jgi:serine protease inhibitor